MERNNENAVEQEHYRNRHTMLGSQEAWGREGQRGGEPTMPPHRGAPEPRTYISTQRHK